MELLDLLRPPRLYADANFTGCSAFTATTRAMLMGFTRGPHLVQAELRAHEDGPSLAKATLAVNCVSIAFADHFGV